MMNNVSINRIVENAAREAGIRDDELFTLELVGEENGIIEMILSTEWNRVDCFADLETGEILGIMAETKTYDEILEEAAKAA